MRMSIINFKENPGARAGAAGANSIFRIYNARTNLQAVEGRHKP